MSHSEQTAKSPETIAPNARADAHETCSRCDGTGDDPEVSDCVCDCCGGTGTEGAT